MLVPEGEGWCCDVLPEKILKFQSPKMQFSAFWGLNWGQKAVLFIQENVAFIKLLIDQSQSIPTGNEQMMKTKLRTFAL